MYDLDAMRFADEILEFIRRQQLTQDEAEAFIENVGNEAEQQLLNYDLGR